MIYVCMIRMGGFVAFVIYMVTTYALYVPDWSFVVHGQDGPKRYTVCINAMTSWRRY